MEPFSMLFSYHIAKVKLYIIPKFLEKHSCVLKVINTMVSEYYWDPSQLVFYFL